MSLLPPQVNGIDGETHTSLVNNVETTQITTVTTTTTTAQILDANAGSAPGEPIVNNENSSSEMDVDVLEVLPQEHEASTSSVVVDNSFKRASSLPASLEPKYKFGYVYDDSMMLHAPQEAHPEMPVRILKIFQSFQKGGVIKYMKRIPIRSVKKFEVLLVHSEDHWDKVDAIKRKSSSELDPLTSMLMVQCLIYHLNDADMTKEDIALSKSYYDHLSLYVSEMTTKSALLSCGGTIEAALAVARGELSRTFAIVRPPGHHAEPEEHMGFCFINNVAVATRVVQQLTPIKRILILDWCVNIG